MLAVICNLHCCLFLKRQHHGLYGLTLFGQYDAANRRFSYAAAQMGLTSLLIIQVTVAVMGMWTGDNPADTLRVFLSVESMLFG